MVYILFTLIIFFAGSVLGGFVLVLVATILTIVIIVRLWPRFSGKYATSEPSERYDGRTYVLASSSHMHACMY